MLPELIWYPLLQQAPLCLSIRRSTFSPLPEPHHSPPGELADFQHCPPAQFIWSPWLCLLFLLLRRPQPQKSLTKHLPRKFSCKSQSLLFSVSLCCYIFFLIIHITGAASSTKNSSQWCSMPYKQERVPTTKRKVFTGNGQKMEALSLCWAKQKLSMWILSSLNKLTKSVTDVGIKFRSCIPAMGHNSSC